MIPKDADEEAPIFTLNLLDLLVLDIGRDVLDHRDVLSNPDVKFGSKGLGHSRLNKSPSAGTG